MKNGFSIIIILIVFSIASCAKIDRQRPVINWVKVNGIDADSLFLSNGTFSVNYNITDNELIQSCRIYLQEQVNNDSAFYSLVIKDVNTNSFTDELIMVVPDSVILDSNYFSLKVDAFDNSGNQAIQRKLIINFN